MTWQVWDNALMDITLLAAAAVSLAAVVGGIIDLTNEIRGGLNS